MSQTGKITLVSLSVIVLLFVLSTAMAQESTEAEMSDEMEADMSSDTAAEEEVIELEEQVVIGSRARPRSVIDSAVPIDTIRGDDLAKQGVTDLQDMFRNLVPSYNVNTQPISDAGTVVRPANLRGLAPDHTLVLVNNKRRHRAAVIHWLGNGLADGAQGPDLSAIPAIALKQVEILRDGAAAQYGSDAIAGVMNFQLKDSHEGGSFEFKPGIYQYGDGRQYAVAGNIGLGSQETWANLSLEYGGSDPTIRSVQRDDAKALVAAGNDRVRDPAQIWGQPIVEDDLKFFANYGSVLTDNIDFYGHANYASKRVDGGFYFRNPNTRSGVFSTDGGETLLVGNLAGGEYPNIPITNDVPDPDELAKVFADPNLFTFQEMFPGGFTPRFGADAVDSSVLVGIKGNALESMLTSGLGWDLSGYFGRHHADFFIYNTVNASLGPDTPTDFNPGDYIQTDYNLNFDLTYPLSDMLFLASGVEYRNEGFEVVEGQRESYQIGPLAGQGFSAASNGFSGFSQIAAGEWNRANVAAYLESEVRPLKHWLVGLAVRGEDFEDFGQTFNYKVATNIGVTDFLEDANMIANDEMILKLRGSYSTGFRAPTPGQQNTFNVTTEFNFEKDDLVNNGTIPSTNRAAALVGGKALEPETSTNFTSGFTFEVRDINLTIDLFDVRMKDRLALSQDFALSEEQKDELLKAGVTSAANLQEFRFFTNDFDTTTQGIDVVLTVPVPNGDVTAVYNRTETTVTDHNPETLDDLRIKELEENLPRQRGSLTVTQSITSQWSVLGRSSYYGDWYDSEDDETYTGKVLFDLESSYMASAGLVITIGVQNLLNTYPDENPKSGNIGNQYGQFSPFGFNGAFWYAKFGYTF
ncbi:TonB-dependent receptor [Candidatus Poribacteria bacterium]|nr:TonB-dependent receptor [Candidatus Poribacteria bacterium]